MIDFLKRNKQTIFTITVITFVVGTFAGFGGYYFSQKMNIVAKVNNKKITYQTFEKLYTQRVAEYQDKNKDSGEIGEEMRNKIKKEVLQDLINEEALYQEAVRLGIEVTDNELLMNIQNTPAFQRDGQFDRAAYFSVLKYSLHSTPQEFEDDLRHLIAINKLRKIIAGSAKITKKELEFQQKELYQKLASDKMMAVFNDWLKDLSRRIQIKVYLDDIEKRLAKSNG